MRNTGIILSLLGVGIWGISLCFTTGYQPGRGFLGSLPYMEVLVRPGKIVKLADEPFTDPSAIYQWADTQGKTQISNQPPAAGTPVENFRVGTRTSNGWAFRTGLVRTETRERMSIPLRATLAIGFALILLGVGQVMLRRSSS